MTETTLYLGDRYFSLLRNFTVGRETVTDQFGDDRSGEVEVLGSLGHHDLIGGGRADIQVLSSLQTYFPRFGLVSGKSTEEDSIIRRL